MSRFLSCPEAQSLGACYSTSAWSRYLAGMKALYCRLEGEITILKEGIDCLVRVVVVLVPSLARTRSHTCIERTLSRAIASCCSMSRILTRFSISSRPGSVPMSLLKVAELKLCRWLLVELHTFAAQGLFVAVVARRAGNLDNISTPKPTRMRG